MTALLFPSHSVVRDPFLHAVLSDFDLDADTSLHAWPVIPFHQNHQRHRSRPMYRRYARQAPSYHTYPVSHQVRRPRMLVDDLLLDWLSSSSSLSKQVHQKRSLDSPCNRACGDKLTNRSLKKNSPSTTPVKPGVVSGERAVDAVASSATAASNTSEQHLLAEHAMPLHVFSDWRTTPTHYETSMRLRPNTQVSNLALRSISTMSSPTSPASSASSSSAAVVADVSISRHLDVSAELETIERSMVPTFDSLGLMHVHHRSRHIAHKRLPIPDDVDESLTQVSASLSEDGSTLTVRVPRVAASHAVENEATKVGEESVSTDRPFEGDVADIDHVAEPMSSQNLAVSVDRDDDMSQISDVSSRQQVADRSVNSEEVTVEDVDEDDGDESNEDEQEDYEFA